MSWRQRIAELSPEARAEALAALDGFDEEAAEIAAMTDEQLTLSLARDGTSPEDVRRSLGRALDLVARVKDQREQEEFEIDRLVSEGGR